MMTKNSFFDQLYELNVVKPEIVPGEERCRRRRFLSRHAPHEVPVSLLLQ